MSNIIFIYAEKVIQLSFGFLVTFFLVRHFDTEDYGVYKYILSLVSFFVIFTSLGFNSANVRYIPEYLFKSEKSKVYFQIDKLSKFFVSFVVFSLVVFYVITCLFTLSSFDKINVVLILFLFLFSSLKNYFGEGLHIAFSERLRLTKIRVFLYFLQAIIILYAVFFDKSTIFEFQYYLFLYAALEAFSLIASTFFIYKINIGKHALVESNLSSVYYYSAYNYGFSWANFFKDNAATVIVVAHLFTFTEVSYYSIALLIPNIVRGFTPSKVFGGFLMPLFVKEYSENNNLSSFFDGINFLGKLNVLFLVPALVFSVYSYTYIIELFFYESYAYHTFLLAFFLFLNIFLMSFLDVFMISTNTLSRPDLVFKVNLFSTSNILFLFLFHGFGLESIGFSNLLSTLFTILIFFYVSNKTWSSGVKLYFFDFKVFVYAAFLSVLLFLVGFFVQDKFFVFIVRFFISTISIFIFLRSAFFSKKEKELIKDKIFHKIRFLL